MCDYKVVWKDVYHASIHGGQRLTADCLPQFCLRLAFETGSHTEPATQHSARLAGRRISQHLTVPVLSAGGKGMGHRTLFFTGVLGIQIQVLTSVPRAFSGEAS